MRIEYIELRKDPRINTAVEVTYCTSLPPKHNGGGDPSQGTGTLTDWGDGGAGLVLDQPFRPNETLRLQGFNGSREPRDCIVQWVQKDRERYRVGVKFTDTDE